MYHVPVQLYFWDAATHLFGNSAGRPAVFAVFADTRKISGYHVRCIVVSKV
eukprot:COSAG01_NODE_5842_length_4001_cov_13.893388_1_plen_51_part_00